MSPPSFLAASLTVALGGGVGAWLRYVVGRLVPLGAFPWATLMVNVGGSFAMGLLVGWLARHDAGESWRLLLGVGLLGGFTTFSAFSLELVNMIERGDSAMAATYALVSVVAGVAGLFAGLMIVRAWA